MPDPKAVLFEAGDAEGGHWMLRQYLEKRVGRLCQIPRAMPDGTPLEDQFADWESPAGAPPDQEELTQGQGACGAHRADSRR